MAQRHAIKDKVQGKMREMKGAATGNMGEEMKGKMQGMKGDLQLKVEQERRRQAAHRQIDRRMP